MNSYQQVQVEKRASINENFGQNRTMSRQLTMSVKEFVDRLLHGHQAELFYLSTQQPSSEDDGENNNNNNNNNNKTDAADDGNDDDDDNNIKMPSSLTGNPTFQSPCIQLLQAKKIPPTINLAGNLKLESCNLWMGATTSSSSATASSTTTGNKNTRKGSCSGLHHDYHDNFYILLHGKKQFHLFSPDIALQMKTYGNIERIHFNGVISYVGSETRSDGMPLGTDDDDDNDNDNDNDDDEDFDVAGDDEEEEEEEEVVLGKGFDYVESDEEFDEQNFDENAVDDFDDIMMGTSTAKGMDSTKKVTNQEGKEHEEQGCDQEPSKDSMQQQRPNNFSTINLQKQKEETEGNDGKDKIPFTRKCPQSIVEIHPGEVLYLPAGWFHSVTSFGSFSPSSSLDGKSEERKSSVDKANATSDHHNVHMALNFWYHPPDRLDSFQKPYIHNNELLF